MAAVGGPIESVALAGRLFPVAADADVQRKMGGFENEVQSNGDGSARAVKTRVPWSLSDVRVSVDDGRGDQEFLQNLQDKQDFFTIALTFCSGDVYSGRGQITGEVQYSSANATAALALSGPGQLSKQ
jgi:hypothetical protein